MSGTYTVHIDGKARASWDRALSAQTHAYQQDWSYGEVMYRTGAKVLRASIEGPGGDVCGLAQLVIRPIAMIGQFALCSYGPVWLKSMGEGERTLAFHALRKAIKLRWPRLIAFSPDQEAQVKGFRQIMTGDSTIRIDLTQDEDQLRQNLDGKWRNRLVKAEKSKLRFSSSGRKPGQYQWLLDAEMAQRQKRGYRGLPPALVSAWQEDKARAKGAGRTDGVEVFRADLRNDPAAAMLFLIHGSSATYHIGWSNDDGRDLGGHNLVLWNAMLALKEKGITSLDLGGVNTASGAGIARFKLGTGGKLIRRSGTFV